MTYINSGAVRLHCTSIGAGPPVVFLHELAGDGRSWEPQVHALAAAWRCTTFNARGYPPSDVPQSPDAYSTCHAVDDLIAVMDACEIEAAHLVGTSMGAYVALQFALRHSARVKSIVACAVGSGSPPDSQEAFRRGAVEFAERFRREGAESAGRAYALAGSRRLLREKDPLSFVKFEAFCIQMDAYAAECILRAQAARESLHAQRDLLAAIDVPVLVITGDEDKACLKTGVFLKEIVPRAQLAVLPRTGHVPMREEPEIFNRMLQQFLRYAEAGTWKDETR